jgi:hypothetical protein
LCRSSIIIEVTAIKCWHPINRMCPHLFVMGFEWGGWGGESLGTR